MTPFVCPGTCMRHSLSVALYAFMVTVLASVHDAYGHDAWRPASPVELILPTGAGGLKPLAPWSGKNPRSEPTCADFRARANSRNSSKPSNRPRKPCRPSSGSPRNPNGSRLRRTEAASLNLTIAERKLGAEIVVKTVNKRVPVSIFVGTFSEEDSLDPACHAQEIGVLQTEPHG